MTTETTIPEQYAASGEQRASGQLPARGAQGMEALSPAAISTTPIVYKWLEAAAWALATDQPRARRARRRGHRTIAGSPATRRLSRQFLHAGQYVERNGPISPSPTSSIAPGISSRRQSPTIAPPAKRACSISPAASPISSATPSARRDRARRPAPTAMKKSSWPWSSSAAPPATGAISIRPLYFLDARGYGLVGGDEYHQDHVPFREATAVVGHAVRQVYLTAGAADIYAETRRPTVLAALDRLWDNMTTRRIYVTGGIGARWEGEAFGSDFELPNLRAYTESCAAIGSIMWNWRMLLITGDAKYADLIETTLYNAMLPGISLSGDLYFYQNPLADDGTHRRQPWFDCACCPPNIARTLAALGGYVATTSDDALWLHLYAQSDLDLELSSGSVHLHVQTDYPWDESVRLTVDGSGDFSLRLRIPGWSESGATLIGQWRACDCRSDPRQLCGDSPYLVARRSGRAHAPNAGTSRASAPQPLRKYGPCRHVPGTCALLRGTGRQSRH